MMRCAILQLISAAIMILLQIVNGYLAAMASKYDDVFVMNSHLVTAVITRQTSEMSKSLLSKVCAIKTTV